MRRTKTQQKIRIDGEALKKAIFDGGHTLVEVSAAMGLSNNFLSGCAYKGEISVIAAKTLQALYGISPEKYEYKETSPEPAPVVQPPQETAPVVSIEIDYERLGEVIYEAMRKALAGK